MRVAIIASHAWPIPSAARTGDIFVLDLCHGLEALGEHVTLYAPSATNWHRLREGGSANGARAPITEELALLRSHEAELRSFDIVHDISASKVVGLALGATRPVCMTLTGGPWREPSPPINLCVFSDAQRDRVVRGATDYEGTPDEAGGGPNGVPVYSARVVRAGVDTNFYAPAGFAKGGYHLWLNRWHPAKGYSFAIRLAIETGLQTIIAGIHPQDATNEHERTHALLAESAARNVPNIQLRWLPGDDTHDDEKRKLYRRAISLLYPVQFQEPFGLSMAEALACGTPVVASRMGSVPEIVTHGVTGWVCNLDAAAIESFAAGMRATVDMSPARCRDEAQARFSRNAMATSYRDLYTRIIGGERW